MRSADIGRAVHAPFRIEPRFGQVLKDRRKVVVLAEESRDVLKEAPSRADLSNNVNCLGPHVSLVVSARALAGEREGLAGKSGADAVNHTLIAFGVPVTNECSDIAEYWSDGEDAVFDSGGEDSLAVVIEFNVTYSSPT